MHIICRHSYLKLVAAIAICLGGASAMANIVQNSGFETGDLTDWTVNASSSDPWRVNTTNGNSGGNPFGGNYYVTVGCVGAPCITGTVSQQASLSQSLTTVAGQTYGLTFWFTTNGNGTSNELNVLWDGTSVLDLGPGGTLGVVQGSSGIHSYQEFTVTGLVGSGSNTLTFLGRQDPGWSGLDNVDVESLGTTPPVPEPSTSNLLLVGGLIPLFAAIRRRSK